MPKKLIPIGSSTCEARVFCYMQSGELPRPPMVKYYFRCKASVVNKRVCYLTLKIIHTTIITTISILSSLFYNIYKLIYKSLQNSLFFT